jgi:salicylate hydroxylase
MPDDVSAVLRRYEEIRKPRATRLQQASAANRTRFHLHDGPEQQARDAPMATSGRRAIGHPRVRSARGDADPILGGLHHQYYRM